MAVQYLLAATKKKGAERGSSGACLTQQTRFCVKRAFELFVHRSTLQCIRTMDCEYALCSLFVPGDRQVIVGTKVNSLPSVLLTQPKSGSMF